MLVTEEALQKIDKHWAVLAVGCSKRDRGLDVVKARLVRWATQRQMTLDFQDQPEDDEILDRLSLAYEIAAIEGLEAVLNPGIGARSKELREQCYAGAWRAFELRCLLPVPSSDEQRIFHVLHLAALAYCGDRWTDLRRWLVDQEEHLAVPSVADAKWDRRLLFKIFDCWIRLLRKKNWDDLDRIREIIAGLRKDQSEYEEGFLSTVNGSVERTMALRLVATYHWAKATELLAVYLLQGTPPGIAEELDKHFEASRKATALSQDAPFEVLQKWLHVAARKMVAGSVWWVARAVNSHVTKFIESVTKSQAMFELLPPQRAALQEQGLLDQANRAIIVEMPTSGGKTLLAQFRMLQALNQFAPDKGWVAYVAPARALVAQITRRLRRDFEPLGITVEALSSAIEVDAFENEMLAAASDRSAFDVLVSTPEKLQLVIRNKKVSRPLALVVMDEAHNIEDVERGMRIELLLATIRRECERANFLLLMPYVPNSEELANWLAPDASKSISIGSSAWKPNERIIGLYQLEQADGRGNWTIAYETLVTTPKTVQLGGRHRVGGVRPLGISRSRAKSLIAQTGAMAAVFSKRGTSIAVANTIPNVWSMARLVAGKLLPYDNIPGEVALVQRFLAAEISPEFELIEMLSRGVAVHHAGLPDEARALIEWLAEERFLRVLCATTTISQGINFPVSSVFLASIKHQLPDYPYQLPMSEREFWNLAGRAGRLGQDTVGVIGLAAGSAANELKAFVSQATGKLVSRLIYLLDEVEITGQLNNLQNVLAQEQWRDFRCYVAHLWAEKKNLDAVIADTEQLLRHTFGYVALRSEHSETGNAKADALLKATRDYVHQLSQHPENATLADSTGFAPEGVGKALMGLDQLENKLSSKDWDPGSLFGDVNNSSLPNLIGIMLNVPELRGSLEEITRTGLNKKHLAEITTAWVNGVSIPEIAKKFFTAKDVDMTKMITDTCKAIYKTIVNSGPWGLAALSKMPTSGLDFKKMSDDLKRRLNVLPAMIYYGVRTEEAVLMRVNSVPRSIAESMGGLYKLTVREGEQSVTNARQFLRSLGERDWNNAVLKKSRMSGADYREVWRRLNGE